jgi:large subunit ribosomal protein L24
MANIKKGDLVQVISGPTPERGGDRGKQGKVLEVLVEQDRVIVEGVNYVTKHVAPIHISNVQVVDPETKKPTRVGHRVEEQVKDGVKRTVRVRYAKKSGKDL